MLVTLELNTRDWDERATPLHCPSLLNPATVSGASAYAYKQADVQCKLVKVFLSKWYDILEHHPLASSWLSNYPHPPPDNHHRLVCNVKLYHSTPGSSIPKVHSDSSNIAGGATSITPTNNTGQPAR